MFVFDLAYELTLGAVCAALDARRAAGAPARGAFRDGLLASALVYAPLCTVGLVAWPGWQTMYLADVERSPARLLGAAVAQALALGACYVAGHAAGSRLAREPGGGRRIAWILAIAWPMLLAALFGVMHRRAFTVTTYAAFDASSPSAPSWGAPGSLLGGPLTPFLIAAALANGLAAAIVVARSRSTAPARRGS